MGLLGESLLPEGEAREAFGFPGPLQLDQKRGCRIPILTPTHQT